MAEGALLGDQPDGGQDGGGDAEAVARPYIRHRQHLYRRVFSHEDGQPKDPDGLQRQRHDQADALGGLGFGEQETSEGGQGEK